METIWNRFWLKKASSKLKSKILREYAIFFQNGVLEIQRTRTRTLNIFQFFLVTLLIPHFWIRPSAGSKNHPARRIPTSSWCRNFNLYLSFFVTNKIGKHPFSLYKKQPDNQKNIKQYIEHA